VGGPTLFQRSRKRDKGTDLNLIASRRFLDWDGAAGIRGGTRMRERLKRLKCVMPSEEKFFSEAERAREKAKTLPPGKEQDALVRWARESETAARIDQWINSPGLQPPK
jgi:hypothetical protein